MALAKQYLERAIALWALIGGVLLLLIVGATVVNALGFTANAIAKLWGGNVSGLPGYEDGVTLLIGVAALAMFPYCQLHQGHAVVDVFMMRASARLNKTIFLLSTTLTIALALALGYMSVLGTVQMRSDAVETAVLGWPVWVFAATALPSCLLWAAATILQFLNAKERHDGP